MRPTGKPPDDAGRLRRVIHGHVRQAVRALRRRTRGQPLAGSLRCYADHKMRLLEAVLAVADAEGDDEIVEDENEDDEPIGEVETVEVEGQTLVNAKQAKAKKRA